MLNPVAVVHLVWGPLGPAPLEAFLAAYRARPAGAPHDLVILLNGVERRAGTGGAAAREPLLRLLEGVEHVLVELDRAVLDLAAYVEAAARLDHDRLCFLNSYSEPLVDGWLARLEQASAARDVAMAGATCSWASHSSHVRYLLGLGGPYTRAYGDRDELQRAFAPGSPPPGGGDRQPPLPSQPQPQRHEPPSGPRRSPAQLVSAAALLVRQLTQFPAFPDPHLRTNAFVIDRRLLLRLNVGRLREKTDTYAIESGRRSLTRQVQRTGGRVVVVGRDGRSYAPEQWAQSRTFWQSSQENLLIADNQTYTYQHGDMELRRMLSAHAWGEHAEPRPQAEDGAHGAP
jgi:hypothetical protein